MAQVLSSNYLLILGCIGASLWTWSLLPNSPSFVEQNLVFSYNNLQAGRLWTLVTALFVHGSPIHLLGNMIFLFVFGNTLEKTIGSHARLLHRRTYGIPIEHTLLPSRHRNDRCLRCHLYPRSIGHAYSTIEVFMALPRSAGPNRHCLLHVQCLRSREPWATRAKLRSKRRIRCTHYRLRHRNTLRYRFCQAVEAERIDHPRTTRSLPSHTLRDLTLFW